MRVYFTCNLLFLLLISCNSNHGNSNLKKDEIPLYTLLSHSESNINFKNNIKETLYMNRLFYEYFYNGGGVAVGDFNNDDLQDVYFISNLEQNKLYLNKGNFKFKDITSTAGVQGKSLFPTGVTTVDINCDGLLDIYVCSSGKFNDPDKRRNELFINQGINPQGIPVFKEEAQLYGLDLEHFSTQASFFDYDLDGDLDMFLINHDVNTYGIAELEEYLNTSGELSGERLFKNDNRKYIDITNKAGIINNRLGFGLGVAIGDVNNDLYPDIYVSHDYSGNDHFYINNKDGTFSEKGKEALKHISFYSMGNDIADYNNDGLLDICTVDMVSEDNYGIKTSMSGMNISQFQKHVDLGLHYQYMYNTLQTNHGIHNTSGVPYFSETAQLAGISSTDWSWGPLFLDMDNDGYLDIFVANGIKRDFRNNDFITFHKNLRKELTQHKTIDKEAYINKVMSKMPTRKKANYFYKNNRDLTFTNISKKLGLDSIQTASNGAAYADLDNDGDLDIIVNNMDDYAYIYRNNSELIADYNYLRIKLKGPQNNTMGIGARVMLTNNGEQQIREHYVSRGFQSSVESSIHFGLGSNKIVEELKIIWNDGKIQTLKNIIGNQVIELDYNNGIPEEIKDKKRPTKSFTDAQNTYVNHCHKENNYNDFEKEILLPHKMSELGPAFALGDINNDGLDDFFIGGAMGYPGTIYIQSANGKFTTTNNYSFIEDKYYEDTGAVFFDADMDGDLDLYVASGGNEREANSIYYQDRLYINKSGVFVLGKDFLPKIYSSGSCVKPFDFDNDGDLDLFVGGRQVPGKYPLPASSFILENKSSEGEFYFKNVSLTLAPMLENIGMVTDAVWADIDNDTLTDLIIVGEWMPVTVLKNNVHNFEDMTSSFGLENQLGWWNTINVGDFNKDGYVDFIAGNLGLNYKYKASLEEPFEIYAKDFDNSGSLDIVLGYYNEGHLFPLRGRECSSNQMPFIKEKFNSYDMYGKATLSDIYGMKNLHNAIHYKANTFATTYFKNENGRHFIAKPLDNQIQKSSVNSILIDDLDGDGYTDVILAGNMYDSEVETPRNDASYGAYISYRDDDSFKVLNYEDSGILIDGEVKHMKILKGENNKKTILIVKNDNCMQQINFLK